MTKISICLGLDIQRVNANVTTDLSHFRALGSLPLASALLYSAWGAFQNTYELLNLRAPKFSPVNKIRIFQCMGMMFCVEFQRYPLKLHAKYLTHTLKDVTFMQH